MNARIAFASALALSCAACDRESGDRSAAPPAAAAPGIARVERLPRSNAPEIAKLRRHIDLGDVAAARALLPAAELAGDEALLLKARCDAMSGEFIAALRSIESARARSPRDPDVYATAAEIYAAAGKPESAWSEIGRGTELCGESPELLRAKGVVWLLREGGAERGLAFLEDARAKDPSLPFTDRALAQAHLLCGKNAMRAKDLDGALRHARRASDLDPGDVDAQRFLADVLAGRLDFDGAIEVLRELAQSGEPLDGDLASLEKRAGMASLLAHDRESALSHFAAARAHGMSDADLATGARLLLEEARARVALGVEAYEAGDARAAEARFRSALVLEPDLIEAQNHLAVVLFQRRELAEAIELWQAVLQRARAEDIELPEPVHMNLAKAQFQNGNPAAARATLEESLRREPNGPFASETRGMLERIPPK